jgi:hypothetical protein
MLRTIEGIYRKGEIELAEQPDGVGEAVPVLVTFLEAPRVDLQARGIDEVQAAGLRARLVTFAADWDRAEMDVYNDYDSARAKMSER